MVEHLAHVGQPAVRVLPGGEGGKHAGGAEFAEQVRWELAEAVQHPGGTDVGHRTAHSGQVERLTRRRQGDRAGGRLRRQRGERHERGGREGEIGVDLVRDHQQVVFGRQVRQRRQVRPSEAAACRVVRVHQENDPGLSGHDGLAKPFIIQNPAACGEFHRHGHQPPAHRLDRLGQRWVAGDVQRHRVAGGSSHVEYRLHGLLDVGELAHQDGIGRPAVALGHPVGERLAQRRTVVPQPGRVAEIAAAGQRGDRVPDRRRGREVHIGQPGRDHPGCGAVPLDPWLVPQPGQPDVELGRHRHAGPQAAPRRRIAGAIATWPSAARAHAPAQVNHSTTRPCESSSVPTVGATSQPIEKASPYTPL